VTGENKIYGKNTCGSREDMKKESLWCDSRHEARNISVTSQKRRNRRSICDLTPNA
jgi:hypothetical protein